MASICSPFLLLCLWSVSASAQQATKSTFDVTWGGKVVAKISHAQTCPVDNRSALQLKVKSVGLVEQMHSLRTEFKSLMRDPSLGFERSYVKIVEESVPRTFKSIVKKDGTTTQRLFKGKQKTAKRKLPSPTHDMLTWLSSVQTQTLNVGDKFSYFMWDGWKLSRLDFHVKKNTSIYLPESEQAKSVKRLKIMQTVVDAQDPAVVKRETKLLGELYLDPKNHALAGMDYSASIANAKIRRTSFTSKRCR